MRYRVSFECASAPCAIQIGGSDANPVIVSGDPPIEVELDDASLAWLSADPGTIWPRDYRFTVEAVS